MTSRIGNKGFSFIELMITLTILGGGIVMIFQSFLICVDYLNHVHCRYHASNLIENKIAETEFLLKQYNDQAFATGPEIQKLTINNKEYSFVIVSELDPVDNLPQVYRMDIGVSWTEGNRDLRLESSAYISSVSALEG